MIKKMSVVLVVLVYCSFTGRLNAQEENDTTKIKMGNKKILIIEDETEKIKKIAELKNGKLEFENDILSIEDSIKHLKAEKEKIDDENSQRKIEEEIRDCEKQKKALEKGISQIEDDIADLEKKRWDNEDKKYRYKYHNDFWWDFKGKRVRNFNGHWAGFDVGLNNFLNANNEMEMPEDGKFMELKTGSWAFNLNFLEYNMQLVKGRAGFTTGMGFEWNNYNFKKDIILHEDENGIITGTVADVEYDLNKLHTGYLTVPFLFEIQSGSTDYGKRFYFNFGVIGGVKIGSKTKQEFEENDDKHKSKVKGDYQLSTFRYAVTARVGYRALRLFASYNLVPLFKNDKGPELYPFTVGLTLADF